MEVPSPNVPPLVVAMVSAGPTDLGAPIPSGTEAKTPDHQPNVILTVVSRAGAVAIRAANVGITVFLSITSIGNLASAMIGDDVPTINFKNALWMASLAALGEALKSTATILSGLEKAHPLYTGNV